MLLSLSVLIGVALISSLLHDLHDSANVVATIFILSEVKLNHASRAFRTRGW